MKRIISTHRKLLAYNRLFDIWPGIIEKCKSKKENNTAGVILNMKELSLREIREIQLYVLKEVAHFCDEHHLRYYLSSGTLLGAIRHKGYIPWDDDIDIMLPRKDYDRLLKTFSAQKKLRLFSYDTEKHYFFPFAKIAHTDTIIERPGFRSTYGINIDVFPIDGFPDGAGLIEKHVKKVSFYRRLAYLKSVNPFPTYKKRSLFKNIISMSLRPFLLLIPRKWVLNKINGIASSVAYDSSKNIGMVTWGYGIKEVCPKKVFQETIEVEFEKGLYHSPKEYKVYLSNLYGHFMELPPDEKRVTHHNYKAYKID